ncbi:hypothetical protein H0H81_004260 [Sphagnurus paluster]|uniref:F-box domain-containing protein n=1 Tax=Sphagnurus paluster TaxID=117069 RepID=A0A9P7GGV3_9AGAR|nr:hypothetical protein H0H81_004260 [Sphagnurus paluster]
MIHFHLRRGRDDSRFSQYDRIRPTESYYLGQPADQHRPRKPLKYLSQPESPTFQIINMATSASYEQMPPEILAAVFEVGILTWGIQFLPPLCLVCNTWNEIITTTPRLWGIIAIDRESNCQRLQSQISKAKSSPLSIFVRRTSQMHEPALRMLVQLSSNWIKADVPTSMLMRCRWSVMSATLETLRLSGSNSKLSTSFFDDAPFHQPPRLRSFTAAGIPESYISPFLSPFITYFDLSMRSENGMLGQHLARTLGYLAKIPHVSTLKVGKLYHATYDIPSGVEHPLHLAKLQTLEIDHVQYPSSILCELSAPSLQTLSIRGSPVLSWRYQHLHRPELVSLTPFLIAWSHSTFLPSHLHTLVLEDCLDVSDIPFLIRWLARLPGLVRLTLYDDAFGHAAAGNEDGDVLKALASPAGTTGPFVGDWLCPALMQLRIQWVDLEVKHIFPLATTRGGKTVLQEHQSHNPPVGRLRYIEAPLCPCGSPEDIKYLKELVDEGVCACLGCQFNVICELFLLPTLSFVLCGLHS